MTPAAAGLAPSTESKTASIQAHIEQAIDDLLATLPDPERLSAEQRRGIIARYTAVLEGNFIYWMTGAYISAGSDEARAKIMDNLREEVRDSHPGMMRRFAVSRRRHVIAAREHVGPDSLGPSLKQAFGGIFVANEAIDQHTGQQLLDAGKADAVAYGKLFIANPDLPIRFARNAPLTTPVPATFYGHSPEGYIDYPSLEPELATA